MERAAEYSGRLAADNDRLKSQAGLLSEELCIKDARMAHIAARERPHYPPPERMAILQLKAARSWSAARTAERFLLTATTIADWMKRLDDNGPGALVRLPQPVNRFPDFVAHIVQTLKTLCPTMGRRRIADTRHHCLSRSPLRGKARMGAADERHHRPAYA